MGEAPRPRKIAFTGPPADLPSPHGTDSHHPIMPPRVATVGAAPSLGDQYRAIPPVTRALATGAVALTAAEKLGLVRGSTLILYWPLVVGRLQVRSPGQMKAWGGGR